MLKQLQKALGLESKVDSAEKPVETLEVKLDTQEIQLVVESLRAEFDEFKETAEAMVAAADEQITVLTAQLAEANAKLADADALAAAAAGKIAELAVEAATKTLAARKEKVVAAIGTERADALLTVTEGMDDATFEAVVSALGVSAAVEAASPLFKEVGVEAQADAAKVVAEESNEMKILKAKYKDQGK